MAVEALEVFGSASVCVCVCVCVCAVEVNVNTALLLRKQKVEQWTGAGRGEDLRLPGGHVPSPR